MGSKAFAATLLLCASALFADKLYLLKISPDEAKELSPQQILQMAQSGEAYDPSLNRDILGRIIKKVRIDEDEVKSAGKGKIYYGKYYVENVSPGSIRSVEDRGSISRMSGSVHKKADTGKAAIDLIVAHLKEAKKLASKINTAHFDKEYLKRDIESILRGLNAYVSNK